MKTLPLLLILIFTAFPILTEAQTLENMEKGALAWTMADGEKWEGRQTQDGPYFAGVIGGFLSGVNSSMFLARNLENPAIYQPESWMRDPKKASASFLAFVRIQKPPSFKQGTEKSAGMILIAWYLASHHASTALGKELSGTMAADYFGVDLEQKSKDDAAKYRAELQMKIDALSAQKKTER